MAPVIWVVVILIGTSWPSITVGPDDIVGLDKVVHFSMYAVLAALILRGTRTPYSTRTLLLVLGAVTLFSALDEFHQAFIPGRSMSAADWIADTLGALAGMLVFRSSPQLASVRQDSHT